MACETARINEELRQVLVDLCYLTASWNIDVGGLEIDHMPAFEHAFQILGWDNPHICKDLQCDVPSCKHRWVSNKATANGHRKRCWDHVEEDE